ncbi:MAG TPA: hypothetical protein VFK78_09660 [Gemmatimonadales bacterium]|nr:hypothetical protein [Gemmatimonadales bacterium]
MFGIPEWAMGVGFIVLVSGIVRMTFGGSGRERLKGRLKGRLGRELLDAGDLERRLAAVEDAQSRAGAGEDVERRLAELEERVDFTERLLAKQRDAERLSPPKS